MSAESSSLSLVLASSQTMRDVSGVGASVRTFDTRSGHSEGGRQSFEQHMNDVANEGSDAQQPRKRQGRDARENERGIRARESNHSHSPDNKSSTREKPLTSEEPSAVKEPSASREPSAVKEPATHKTSSAVNDLSMNKEPSAEKETSARTGRSQAQAPDASLTTQSGNHTSTTGALLSANANHPSKANHTDAEPGTLVRGKSVENTPVAPPILNQQAERSGTQSDWFTGESDLIRSDVADDTADQPLFQWQPDETLNPGSAMRDFSFFREGASTLEALLVAGQTATGQAPTLPSSTLNETQSARLSPLPGVSVMAGPGLPADLAVSSNIQLSQPASIPGIAAPTTMDLRMQVREAVLGLVNRSGSSLPLDDQSLPLSGPGSADAAALNAMLGSSADVGTHTTQNQVNMMPQVMGQVTKTPETSTAHHETVSAMLVQTQASDSDPDLVDDRRLPRWQFSAQSSLTDPRQLSGTGEGMTASATWREGHAQALAMSPANPIALESSGGKTSAQELFDGLLNADTDAGETRAERSSFASNAVARTPQGSQAQALLNTTLPGVLGQQPGGGMTMASSQTAMTLDQSMMQTRVGQQIMMMHEKGIGSARIRLDPPELGSLLIKLEVQDRSAVVHFSAQNPMVRDSLEQQLPRLQVLMDDMGLELSDASVDSQSGGQAGKGDRDGQDSTAQEGDVSEQTALSSDQPVDQANPELSLSMVDQYV